MNIIGTGLSGLVGSRVVKLNPQHQFTDLSLDTGFDILKPTTLETIFHQNDAPVVIHFAAFTDTNAAFLQQGDKSGLCYQLNVLGTQNIVDLCKKNNKHLIHISTDFVFDGTKTDSYAEEDAPHPIDWYGQTKYESEQVATGATIVRIAYPYCAKYEPKLDIVRKIKSKLENHEEVKLFSDQITTPTLIDDIATGINLLIDKKPVGIYHLVGSSSQSVFQLGQQIATTFGFIKDLVKPSSIKDITTRQYPANLVLSNQKFISEFGFTPKTLTDGLQVLKSQMLK